MAVNGQEAVTVQLVVGTPEEITSGRGEIGVTMTEAAARLRVCEKTFRNYVDEGRIAPCAKLGRYFVFRTSEIDALIASR